VREALKAGGDVVATAERLGVQVSDHDTVVKRSTAAVERIDEAVSLAELRGDLRFFNAEYRRRRELAQLKGRAFMSYSTARAKLGEAIAGVAATGGVNRAVVAAVFDKARIDLCLPMVVDGTDGVPARAHAGQPVQAAGRGAVRLRGKKS